MRTSSMRPPSNDATSDPARFPPIWSGRVAGGAPFFPGLLQTMVRRRSSERTSTGAARPSM
jgi:hypothetical protein